MLTNEEARARVARGVAHLDIVLPDWFERIDTGTLALETCSNCIIGQLRFGLKSRESVVGSFDPHYGFDLFECELEQIICKGEAMRAAAFHPLQDAWIDAIADRRLSQAPATSPTLDAVDPVAAAAG